ncbi:hypothetical protein RGQ29_005074 [Quercus rubra]|uniref:EF-hand domain-containing protein n=1 Tax=Quercus rubra TaxID=3512 RepID=A0AAN7E3J9_QUERU|nr:hypothetical protein RGQ29_005074 [Quercus rubra]
MDRFWTVQIIMELVENEEVFSNFVDHKFQELDRDRDGKLSVKELQPAVADIGVALGLPAQGSSPDSDHLYSEVLSEFTHGKQETVSKTEFKEVLQTFVLGMAAGLKRDPVVILRIDGKISLNSSTAQIPRDHLIQAFEKLSVDQGMPPSSDPWVYGQHCGTSIASLSGHDWHKPASQEAFLVELRNVAERVAQHLKEQPGVKRLLSNKFELDKTLNAALENVPRDRNGKCPRSIFVWCWMWCPQSAGLPPIGEKKGCMVGCIPKVWSLSSTITLQLLQQMINADDGKLVKKMMFKKLLTEILGISTNSVVHEPLASSSSLLQPSSQ